MKEFIFGFAVGMMFTVIYLYMGYNWYTFRQEWKGMSYGLNAMIFRDYRNQEWSNRYKQSSESIFR